MDEYSPKRHDIAQLRFLCETLYHDCLANLEESNHGWVNDPTSAVNLQLNELIEHIATFALNYKIKYAEDNKLIAQVDEYLDDTLRCSVTTALTLRICKSGKNPVIGYFVVLSTPAGKIRPVFRVRIITIKRWNYV